MSRGLILLFVALAVSPSVTQADSSRETTAQVRMERAHVARPNERRPVTSLTDARIAIDGPTVKLFVRTSGPITPRAHWLQQTDRVLFVVDLPGVRVGTMRIPQRPGAPVLYAAVSQWRSNPPVTRIALHFSKEMPFRRVERDSGFEWIIGVTDTVAGSSDEGAISVTDGACGGGPVSECPGQSGASPQPPRVLVCPELPNTIPATESRPAPPTWRDRRVTLSFREARLPDVLRVIGEQNGINILIHPDVAGQVSVFLESVRLEDALRSILAVHGYSFRVDREIVTVLPARLDFTNYHVYFLKTPADGTLPDLLRSLVPPPSQLFYYRAENAIVLFSSSPSVAELVETALAQLDRAAAVSHSGN